MLQFFGGLCWAWDNFMQNIWWRVFSFCWSIHTRGDGKRGSLGSNPRLGTRGPPIFSNWAIMGDIRWKWKACQILGRQVNSPCKALSGSHKFYFRSYSILFFFGQQILLHSKFYFWISLFFGQLDFFFFLVKGQLDFLTHTHRGWLIRPKETRAQFYSLISYTLISNFLLKS